MGLLKAKEDSIKRINATELKAMGFELCGWGSPIHRRVYDTRCYELYEPDDYDKGDYHIASVFKVIWFPPTFMGLACPDGFPVDTRGCLWVEPTFRGKPKLVPLKTMGGLRQVLEELHTWANYEDLNDTFHAWEGLPSRPYKFRSERDLIPRRRPTKKFLKG